MRRGRIPLTALRSFESAGRLLSFSRAADELFVTQAAISRQIRELETLLGTKLFHRHHRAVTLTEPGAKLLDRLSDSFDAIADAVDEATAVPVVTELVVSAEPGLAACWLVPRLDRFRAARPDVEVEVLADPHVIEFRSSRVDLAIRYDPEAAEADWPRVDAEPLMSSRVTPVLAPSLLASGPPIRKPADLLRLTLLHDDERAGWTTWLEAAGVGGLPQRRGPVFNDHALVIQMAMRGQGVALGDIPLLSEDIAAGRLIAPFPLTIGTGGYWIVAPDLGDLVPAARAFADWLKAEAAQSQTLMAAAGS
ncbi:transcriptional regulator GcvA [Acidisoma cellulosilytica]|uniref:Transcriptional regulator GcvA n=1 Tax=Acidisoma cellulosilyticum TaxID=2802395 RepID=A0A964E2E0_9PROT|nr:transcriptional regulator GcvA [Acidisoma cellulosilyticum]MCB8879137.1 transcriptional regulator GcvA [Acidisoma cellulosilyticum]